MRSHSGNKTIQKKIFLRAAVFLAAASAVFLFYFHDAVGDTLWHRFHRSGAALFFSRDANLAMEIGNYYFGAAAGGSRYNLEEAEHAYRKAVEEDNKILWGHYQLARIIFMRGDFLNSLVEINKELEANPENLRSLYVRGLIYGYRNLDGDLKKAEADFRRFTEWAPKEWAGYNDLAWVLSKDGEYRQARDAVRKAFREIPDSGKNPWLWNSLGVAELNLENYGNAGRAFATAKELAAGLTEDEWRTSYPGNNPGSAAEGLQAFRDALEENLNSARARIR